MVYKSAWRALLPATCLLCGDPARGCLDLCPACAAELPVLHHGCPRCAMPLAAGGESACGPCLRQPPRFSACIAALRYEYPVSDLVGRFKFQGDLAAGRVLAGLLAARVAALPVAQRADVVLAPVPLHPGRLRERGFNQSERIARVLAAELGLPLAARLIERDRHTEDQKRLGAAGRAHNLEGAFRAPEGVGLRVALVDDVVTTGATANAVTAALLAAGAADVQVWCVARAL
jgi:ComF family protein